MTNNSSRVFILIYHNQFFGELRLAGWNTKQFGPPNSPGIFRGIFRGLGHLHQHGLTHGDIKPENVLLEWKDYRQLLSKHARNPKAPWPKKNICQKPCCESALKVWGHHFCWVFGWFWWLADDICDCDSCYSRPGYPWKSPCTVGNVPPISRLLGPGISW